MATLALAVCVTTIRAQTTRPVSEPDPTAAIDALRHELVDAFNKGDVERMVAHLDPDVVVTWQNGEVSRGPDAVRAYHTKMMSGPKPIVAKLTADPVVDARHVYGDWAVSWGNLHDNYELTDGTSFKFDSRFTATIARRGDVWKITSFHASANAFENPILGIVAKRVGTWAGIGGGVIGMLIGAVVMKLLSRRKRPAAEIASGI